MKTFCKLMVSALMVLVVAAQAFAQTPAPQVALSNITEGVGTITGSNLSWAGFSELVLIPGASFLGVKATTNVLYLGFTGGSTVDIGNMVLYTTNRSGTTITATKKVTLGTVANPSINLTSPSVCPSQPVSPTTPCFIKLDTVKGALSPLKDYYFVVFFSNDSNNQSIGGAQSSEQGALSGYNLSGDETRIKKNGTLPGGNNGAVPIFLTYVTNQ